MVFGDAPTISASLVALLPPADITGPIVDFCVNVIDDTGLAGVFLLMAAGSACIPIPSEATMLFAGFEVSDGDLTLLGVIVAGVTGELIGCLIAYAAGYYGRIDLLERNKLIHIDRKRLDWVDSWFQRRGDLTVFVGRLLPLVRAFISLPAGVAEMPLRRFIPLTLAGSAIWLSGLVLIGRAVGDNWEDLHRKLAFLDYVVVAAVIVGVGYLLIKRRRGPGDPTADAEEQPGPRGGAAGEAEAPPVS